MLGGGFKYCLFSPLFGEDVQFDQYFSDGLKPPTSMSLSQMERISVIFRHNRAFPKGATAGRPMFCRRQGRWWKRKKHPWILREKFGEENAMMYTKTTETSINLVETHEMSMIDLELFILFMVIFALIPWVKNHH